MKSKPAPGVQVIKAFGGPTKMADALGVSFWTVHSWNRNDRIPGWRLLQIRQIAEQKNITLPPDFPKEDAA